MITDEEIFFELKKGTKKEFKKAMKALNKIGESKINYDYETPIKFRIPISNIVGIEKPNTHLSKSIGRPLLKLNLRNDMGEKDSVAWWVPKLDAWEETISKLLNTNL
ncbi:MAG: hypothetical protein ACFFAS_06615 [Promethearchaeota archaeon]